LLQLAFYGCTIEKDVYRELKGLKKCGSLQISKNDSLDAAALAGISKMPALVHLLLNGTNLDDDLLASMPPISRLKLLNALDTQVTAHGAAAIKKKVEGLEVLYGKRIRDDL
jgi:hypothetical protein